jgi:hypothetical protein
VLLLPSAIDEVLLAEALIIMHGVKIRLWSKFSLAFSS